MKQLGNVLFSLFSQGDVCMFYGVQVASLKAAVVEHQEAQQALEAQVEALTTAAAADAHSSDLGRLYWRLTNREKVESVIKECP